MSEGWVTVSAAQGLFPAINGKPLSVATINRWCRKGLDGVVLHSVKIGRQRCIRQEDAKAFISRLNRQLQG
jgi:hypothetical protein